ncbi:MAG: flavodoxin-dependent (E)-4-hydroxy-3-methylbut-2-enyl-diphosphate synthase [bacterium]
MIKARHKTRRINVGTVAIGRGAAVSVQTMTKTDTRDVTATVRQILEVEKLGCDIVRLAVPDGAAAKVLGRIRARVHIPLVADIHFDYRLALAALDAGMDGLRINPGNIGGPAEIREIVRAARGRKVSIRVGVNSGSVEKDILAKHGGPTPKALVESAMRHIRLLEDCGWHETKVSVKASDVTRTVEAYRLLSGKTSYPLHLGVTEAGTFLQGTVNSSAAMSILLAEGIGDTIRVSLTDTPHNEVRVGLALLRALGLRRAGPRVISCPTCGRTRIDLTRLAAEVETGLETYFLARPSATCPTVAVMGCVVNGPGEARHADIAVCGGSGRGAIYVRGRHIKTVPEAGILKALMAEIRRFTPAKGPSGRKEH